MRLRDRLGLDRRRQRQATWVMELVLIGIFFVGIDRGSPTIVINAAVGILVAHLPAVLQRDYDIAMDPALVLWVTAAAFFHAVGVVGGPGGGTGTLYGSIWWWDHFTHALSASVVAGVGYATVRALDAHSEEVNLPPRFVFVFILLFVLAFGVAWEVLEFALGEIAALSGNSSILTQYGLEDTMLDLVFDSIGAVLVATFGTAYLATLEGSLSGFLADRDAE